jgi:hypothetical protein
MARWLHISNIVEMVQRLPAMARGVSDGFCQMVALPLTIWHGQCVIDTSGTPIFFARFRTLAWSKSAFGRQPIWTLMLDSAC